MRLKLGILGAGHFGRFHALKAGKAARLEFLGLADADPARAAAVAAEAGCRVWEAAALMREADAVIIAAPTAFHHELASAAIAAGCHVFVEKPVAATLAEADALVAAAAAAGRVLQVGHIERFSAGMATLRGSKGIGRPLYMEAVRIAPFRPRSLDVTVILDLMIHDLDLVIGLAGSELVGVEAAGTRVVSEKVDIANARLRFANGAQATVTASRASLKMERRLRAFGTEGYASLDFLAREMKLVRKGGEGIPLEQIPGHGIETTSWTEHDNLEAEQAAFVAACLDGRPPHALPVAADGVAGRAALDAALRVEAAVAAALRTALG
ncbi:Gfo/Idh/MocA family protein [Teichococcus oryzae]|uniref:Gfo/Idh/MocA family oxidoreductase n=1 Tax=Teichococcus oryzae TaxID=1608942 RepID=A0A5B2TK78_9PROT|nr:Gfo/Idh/MocA family oxidoreductase [Pseudoroseomonas oryzae]KAA2214872.1 Gfo/Idh/MocA family oxidoreductase [Pseudoroseomonas oryzae]